MTAPRRAPGRRARTAVPAPPAPTAPPGASTVTSRHALGRDPKPRTRRRESRLFRVLGVLLLLGGALSVVDTAITVQCQTDAQLVTNRNISARGVVAQQERDVDRVLVTALVSLPDTDQKGRRAARQRWLTDSQRLAADRAAHPYPEAQSCRHW